MEAENATRIETPPSSLWAGGLLALSLVILQCFLPLNCLDTPALISVCAFALAMPILSYKILADLVRVRRYNATIQSLQPAVLPVKTPYPEVFLFIIGILSALVGMAFAFLHVHWIACVIFSVCSLVVLIAYFNHVRL